MCCTQHWLCCGAVPACPCPLHAIVGIAVTWHGTCCRPVVCVVCAFGALQSGVAGVVRLCLFECFSSCNNPLEHSRQHLPCLRAARSNVHTCVLSCVRACAPTHLSSLSRVCVRACVCVCLLKPFYFAPDQRVRAASSMHAMCIAMGTPLVLTSLLPTVLGVRVVCWPPHTTYGSSAFQKPPKWPQRKKLLPRPRRRSQRPQRARKGHTRGCTHS